MGNDTASEIDPDGYSSYGTLTNVYDDALDVSVWAAGSMKWAVENEIYTGEDAFLNPQTPAKRSLVAVMLYHYISIFGE